MPTQYVVFFRQKKGDAAALWRMLTLRRVTDAANPLQKRKKPCVSHSTEYAISPVVSTGSVRRCRPSGSPPPSPLPSPGHPYLHSPPAASPAKTPRHHCLHPPPSLSCTANPVTVPGSGPSLPYRQPAAKCAIIHGKEGAASRPAPCNAHITPKNAQIPQEATLPCGTPARGADMLPPVPKGG